MIGSTDHRIQRFTDRPRSLWLSGERYWLSGPRLLRRRNDHAGDTRPGRHLRGRRSWKGRRWRRQRRASRLREHWPPLRRRGWHHGWHWQRTTRHRWRWNRKHRRPALGRHGRERPIVVLVVEDRSRRQRWRRLRESRTARRGHGRRRRDRRRHDDNAIEHGGVGDGHDARRGHVAADRAQQDVECLLLGDVGQLERQRPARNPLDIHDLCLADPRPLGQNLPHGGILGRDGDVSVANRHPNLGISRGGGDEKCQRSECESQFAHRPAQYTQALRQIQLQNVSERFLLADVIDHLDQDVVQGITGRVANQLRGLAQVGKAPRHVLEPGLVSLVVRNDLDG